jgi:hypothetical protein
MATKADKLGMYKWMRESLTPPIDIERIYESVLHKLRVHGTRVRLNQI